MDIMISVDLIKKLRNQRSWSQDQLASIAGLSLRTVQRIENEGNASLESSKALASAFEIGVNDLKIDAEEVAAAADANRKGRKYGFIGVAVGMVSAYTAITYSFMNGGISGFEAGVSYGGIGGVCGICCVAIGVLSNKFELKGLNKQRNADSGANAPPLVR
ncbi:MAG: transcriptional regulator with XRE-family HTH domain [Lentisphaeria bacterium]|jgi:transcriptional regulator with XRE-family HTH domain